MQDTHQHLTQHSQPETLQPSSKVAVCALYKFVALPHFEAIRQPLLTVMEQHDIK